MKGFPFLFVLIEKIWSPMLGVIFSSNKGCWYYYIS